MKELSQLDLARTRYAEQTIELWKLDRHVVDLSFEFAFAYGVLGFGYSNLFRWNSVRPPRDLVCLEFFTISDSDGCSGCGITDSQYTRDTPHIA